MDVVVEQEQQVKPETAETVAPVVQSEETSAQPEKQAGTEGTEKKAETEETPQRRESRRQRQLNRERERRIAAETELRLLREQQGKQQQEQRKPVDDEPKREQFESYESFIEARATWRAEKIAEEKVRTILEETRKTEEKTRAQSSQQEVAAKFDSHYQKASDDIDDFDDVMGDAESVELLGAVFGPQKPLSNAAIMEAGEKGPLILYYLAKNPAEVERISKLSPARQAAAIVALEDKVAKPAKQPSKAPAPINPVGQKAEVKKDPADMDDEEYAAYRRRRLAQRR